MSARLTFATTSLSATENVSVFVPGLTSENGIGTPIVLHVNVAPSKGQGVTWAGNPLTLTFGTAAL